MTYRVATFYCEPWPIQRKSLCSPSTAGPRHSWPETSAVTLGWAPGQGVAALPFLKTPDLGLLRWSCQRSQKTVPLEATKEKQC